jgi:hypothetical protein
MCVNGTMIFPYPHSITSCVVIYVFYVHTFAKFAVLVVFCLCRAEGAIAGEACM